MGFDGKSQGTNSASPQVAIPEIMLPQGGSVSGYGDTVAPDPFTGAANYSFPIVVTPARAETPSLVLGYATGGGNGPFGVGFSLGLVGIRRRTDAGIPQYTGADLFMLSGGQQLVPRCEPTATGEWKRAIRTERKPAPDGEVEYLVTPYRPRVESRFDVIEHWVETATGLSHWRIVDRGNRETLLGSDDESRVSDPNEPRHIFEWLVRRVTDTHGNKVEYRYKAEDDANVPDTVSNRGRDHRAARYLARISYGNYVGVDAAEHFAFHVVFDYGEYDLAALESDPDLKPVRPWAARHDPFSTYRSGFEIRTYRRCKTILMVHELPQELGIAACVVGATLIGYDDDPTGSLLTSVQRVGYRLDNDRYATKPMPATVLAYAAFEPTQYRVGTLRPKGAQGFPGMLAGGVYRLVDLYGDGLPGVLYADRSTLTYWRPLGDATYDVPTSLAQAPVEFDLASSQHALIDLAGDGSLDLVVGEAGRGGFYANDDHGGWRPYRSFERYPAEFSAGNATLVDLDGDGLADLYVPIADKVRYYPSRGTAGFDGPRITPNGSGAPTTDIASEQGFVGFADVFGDGLPARVEVASGSVRAWPSLGNGRFAAAVTFGSPPDFGDDLRIDRVLWADVNGSGYPSLLLVRSGRIDICLNLSGNGFAAPLRVDIPIDITDTDDVFVADVLGDGGACLVVSLAGAPVQHFYVDFTAGRRPKLLAGIDNNAGQVTRLFFRTSTDYFLADRARGRPWVTKLAGPIHLLASIVREDQITGARMENVCEYRDGFFDPVERKFRGFGYAQSQDTQSFAAAVWAFPTAPSPPTRRAEMASDAPPVTQPALARTWSNAGAFLTGPALAAQYRAEFFSGDENALELAPNTFSPAILASDAETRREAYAALAQMQMRQEVYAVGTDGLPGPVPISITQTNYAVDLIQPRVDGQFAVFMITPREQATSIYEEVADDPRIAHVFTLETDSYGNGTLQATVTYGRRTVPQGAPPRQQELLASALVTRFVNVATPFHLIGQQCELIEFALNALEPDPGPSRYFDFAACRAQVRAALANVIAFGSDFVPGVRAARPLRWSRALFWNADRTAPLPLGEISAQALLHSSPTAVFPQSLVDAIYDKSVVTPELLREQGGFTFQAADGYWWDVGSVASYGGAESFDALVATRDQFGHATSFAHDRYVLGVTAITDALGQTVTAALDYQTLQPRAVTDVNGVVSEALFDPLGEVLVSSIHDERHGVMSGNQPLSAYRVEPAATFEQVLTDPAKYLQGASSFYFYDLFAWQRDGRPPNSVSLRRVDWYYGDDGRPAGTSRIRRKVDYVDGFARRICQKNAVEPAAIAPDPIQGAASGGRDGAAAASADPLAWVASGRSVFDERAQPVREYLPYVTTTPAYDPLPDVPFVQYSFDATGRVVRSDTPDGFFSRWVYVAWSDAYYDRNDTVTQSPAWRRHIAGEQPLPPGRRAAVEQAVRFVDTPTITYVNSRGDTIQQAQTNIEPGDAVVTYEMVTSYWVDLAGEILRIADPRFYDPAHPDAPTTCNFVNLLDMRGRVMSSCSVDAGLSLVLTDAKGSLIDTWNARGYRVVVAYDTLHRETSRRVIGGGLDQVIQRYEFGSDRDLRNVNRVVRSYDTAGITTTPSYDLNGEAVETTTQLIEAYRGMVDWADPSVVPMMPDLWRQTWQRNANGEIEREGHADGSETLFGTYLNGWLKALDVTFAGDSVPTPVIRSQTYNAISGRRVVERANGTVTRTDYDLDTYRVVRITTTRPDSDDLLQDLQYIHDPIGNVTRMIDGAPPVAQARDREAAATRDFTYDAVYRLTSATGRHMVPDVANELEPYLRTYRYDLSGNITRIRTVAERGGSTRDFVVSDTSNRAVPADMISSGVTPDDFYDATGNLRSLKQPAPMPDVPDLAFDYRNALAWAVITPRREGEPDASYFTYHDGRRRARKVVTRAINGGAATQIESTLYIGDLVVVRAAPDGTEPTEQTLSLRIGVANEFVLITNVTQPIRAPGSTRTFRYQLGDMLGSVALEVDPSAAIITYEEYYPYGGAAVVGGASVQEVAAKRYRYSGKELDRSTGFYYYGQRYYSAWMGRWITPDPSGPGDRIDLYIYADDNPTTFSDRTGFNTTDEEAYWLWNVNQQYRYLSPTEYASNVALAWDEHEEIYKNSTLYASETATFSPALEQKIVDKFSEFGALFMVHNPVLAGMWDNAVAKIKNPSSDDDRIYDYGLARGHLTKIVNDWHGKLDFDTNYIQPFETHHLLLKSLHPELAVTTQNFALATRGSSATGLVGLHEGLFHMLTSAHMGSLYAVEVPAMTGLLKRLVAGTLQLDLTDSDELDKAGFGWLELEDRSKGPALKPRDKAKEKKKKEKQAKKALKLTNTYTQPTTGMLEDDYEKRIKRKKTSYETDAATKNRTIGFNFELF